VLFKTEDYSNSDLNLQSLASYKLKKIKLIIDSSNYFKRRKLYNKLIEENFSSKAEKESSDSNSNSDKRNHGNEYTEEIYNLLSNEEQRDISDSESSSSTESYSADTETIVVRNFKENLGTYTLNKSHHLEKNKIFFEFEKQITIPNTNILNFKLHISKSNKYIILVIENFIENENKTILKNEIEIQYLNEELKLINSFSFKNKKKEEDDDETNNPPYNPLVKNDRPLYENNSNLDKRISEIFLNFKIFYNYVYTQFEDSVKISHIESFDKYLLTCDFKSFLAMNIKTTNSTNNKDLNNFHSENGENKIVYYRKYIFTYDQINNYLILITEDLDMIIYYPIVKSTNSHNDNNKNFNVCKFKKLFQNFDLKNILGISDDLSINKGNQGNSDTKLNLNLINIEIIRSDLLINLKQIGQIVSINLDKFEDHIEENYFEFRIINTNDFSIVNENLKVFNLENTDKKHQQHTYQTKDCKQDKNSYNNPIYTRNAIMAPEIAYSKNTFSNFILIQNYENPNIIMIYEILNPHSKLVGGDYSFLNFKIPIIFVAMIIIFFYQFFKKRNELNAETPGMKKEVFKYLEDQGAFYNRKTYKEESENQLKHTHTHVTDSKYKSILKNASNNSNNNYSLKKENDDVNMNSNADESMNESSNDQNDSDFVKDDEEYKKKILEFLKKKN